MRAHIGAMRSYEPAWLLFASDAAVVALWGGACLLLALATLIMDRRRHRRDRIDAPDRVGWVPWTMLFLVLGVIGAGLLAASLPAALRG